MTRAHRQHRHHRQHYRDEHVPFRADGSAGQPGGAVEDRGEQPAAKDDAAVGDAEEERLGPVRPDVIAATRSPASTQR
jgi:hypothetical protein